MFGIEKIKKDIEEMKNSLYNIETSMKGMENLFVECRNNVCENVQIQLNALNECFNETLEDLKKNLQKTIKPKKK